MTLYDLPIAVLPTVRPLTSAFQYICPQSDSFASEQQFPKLSTGFLKPKTYFWESECSSGKKKRKESSYCKLLLWHHHQETSALEKVTQQNQSMITEWKNYSSWTLTCCFQGGPPLRAAVCLDNVFDLSSADGAAGVGHFLEFEATGVTQTHVPASIDDGVHRVLVANGALVRPRSAAWRERRWLGQADRWVWVCSCVKRQQMVQTH